MTKRTKANSKPSNSPSNTPPQHIVTPNPRAGSSFSDSDYGQSIGPLERGPLGPASTPNAGPASAPTNAPNMAY